MTNPTPPPRPGQSADYPPPGPGSHTSPPPQFQPPGYGPPPGPPSGYGGPPPGPPAKKGTSKALIALLSCVGLFIAFIVVVAVVAAIAPKDSTTTAGTPASTAAGDPSAAAPSTVAPANEPGATLADPAPIGTEVNPAKGWPLKVNSAVLNADADFAKANQYNRPEAGKQFVVVNLTTTNGTGKPAMLMTAVKLSLIGPSGIAIDRTFYPTPPNELKPDAQMQPGATATGNIVFQVPKSDVGQVALLAEPQFTLDENEDQRFLAIQ